MDIEELNNVQVILLCTFVSIVAGVATTVIVLALTQDLEITPVNTTVNRVIERTIEKVQTQAPEVITKEIEIPVVSVGSNVDLSSAVASTLEIVVNVTSGNEVVKGVFIDSKNILAEASTVDLSKQYSLVVGEETIPLAGKQFDDRLVIFESAKDLITLESTYSSNVSLGDNVYLHYYNETSLVLVQGVVNEIDSAANRFFVPSFQVESISVGNPVFSKSGGLIGFISIFADTKAVYKVNLKEKFAQDKEFDA